MSPDNAGKLFQAKAWCLIKNLAHFMVVADQILGNPQEPGANQEFGYVIPRELISKKTQQGLWWPTYHLKVSKI
jgi:hypothetical protein